MHALPPVTSVPAFRPPAPTAAPVITQSVSVQTTQSRSDLLAASDAEWTWVELRDFVVAQIVERFGAFPRDSRKEHAIFNRFISTFGPSDAAAIARYAFGPSCDGWWGKAPIQIQRFCKGSDSYFAHVILQRLADTKSAL